ncbi:hypothetical protein OMP38_33920 [Cohnella ginsengisoli]|uniref:Uncharacterized protein n=1 Tax=Cohnella ginsengisoli TaxID=425004 RepID=A0A9X4KNJ2_9BACL|nr:hypothetical protein [Cohnella ginsengisoli]MDG0795268.1 hypothetical protein [Cohnella ginsengisoli]
MKILEPAREATVYHYKLIRKIPMRPETKYSYMTTALLGAGFVTGFYAWKGLECMAVGLIVMILIHAVVLRITLRRVDAAAGKRWSFRIDWPWIGPPACHGHEPWPLPPPSLSSDAGRLLRLRAALSLGASGSRHIPGILALLAALSASYATPAYAQGAWQWHHPLVRHGSFLLSHLKPVLCGLLLKRTVDPLFF